MSPSSPSLAVTLRQVADRRPYVATLAAFALVAPLAFVIGARWGTTAPLVPMTAPVILAALLRDRSAVMFAALGGVLVAFIAAGSTVSMAPGVFLFAALSLFAGFAAPSAGGIEREAHLNSILETIPDALIVIDDAGRIQSFSSAAERQFLLKAADVIGKNVSILMPQPHRQAHDGYIARYLQTGERRIIGMGRIVAGERSDGSTFPMELSVGEVKSRGKRYFTGFVRDLTERQKTQKRLQELQSELIHVGRLTAMGEMATALAHELNQPLSAIANYLKGASRLLTGPEPDAERLRDALDRATAQAIRAGEIIRRLREFIGGGDVEKRPEPLSILTGEAIALALVGVDRNLVRVRINADTDDRVIVDRVQIQQVLINLVRNAVEAMADAPVRELEVRTGRRDDGFALVTVTDTGPGLTDALAARIFDPFMTTKKTGMGVGLSICRTIIEGHGGRIWVEPKEGGGVFAFTLPLATDEASHGA